ALFNHPGLRRRLKEIIALSLVALCVTGCAFTPSRLNADPTKFNGLTVIARGYVDLSRESHALYDSRVRFLDMQRQRERGGGEVNGEAYCISIAKPEFFYKNYALLNGRVITLKGKFTIDRLEGNSVDHRSCLTSIVVDTADLARRYQLRATR
ncbi:MAG TPA: hypothetical protein VEW08_16165, partial [Steroidobacteraceae bacterium]|nr:hypothetical protein [Steroidobacteraceae bacterium]